jgi:replicative DNA helicase
MSPSTPASSTNTSLNASSQTKHTVPPKRFAHLFDNTETGNWETPIAISSLPETPPTFPVQTLPCWMQAQAKQVAEELQVAVDLPATMGLVALSIIYAGRYNVHVKNTWKESLNLYLVVALPPGAGKSPAFAQMLGPIRKYDLQRATEAQQRQQHVNQTRRIIEKLMKKAEERGDTAEARMQLDQLEQHPEVVIPRIIADDATPEALIDIMAKQGGRLALISSEGGPFDLMAGRYSDKANLDIYLKAFTADTIIVDRVARGSTAIAAPHLTIGLTVQPEVVRALADHPELAGKGLTARFMYSVPVDMVGHRNMSLDYTNDTNIGDEYTRRLTKMLHHYGTGEQTSTSIVMDPEARTLFTSMRQRLEDQRITDGRLKPLAEWTTKLESSIVRVAGLFALTENKHSVDADSMRRALLIGDYWLAHAFIVHDLWGTNETLRNANIVMDWHRQKDTDTFTVRDIHRAMSRRFVNVDDIRPVLETLTERGWIRPLFDGPLVLNKRGVESPKYVVHPDNKHRKNTQQTQNP